MSETVFSTTRYLTGAAYNHAYVYVGNRVVCACRHKHKRALFAQRCADKMLRRYLKNAKP